MKNGTRHPLTIILILFLITLSPLLHSQNAEAKSFLWKVETKGGKAYLLGSIHFMKSDAYPLDNRIEKAFGESDALAVEANINDVGGLDVFKLMEGAVYMSGDSLENHVSKETFDLVKKETSSVGLPVEVVEMQKPWFVAMSLSSLELLKLGYDPSLGIDMHFLSGAGTRQITELEGLDYQIGLFSGFSDEEQELFLLQTLREIKFLNRETDALVHAWKTGDAKGLESVMARSIEGNAKMARVYEKLLFERNRNMVSKIQGFLGTGRTYFVVVGAAHLVGKKGIVQMLKDKGFKVDQL